MKSTVVKPRLLIVEYEPALLDAMVTTLNMEGFVADGVGSLGAAESWLHTHEFDILVLDLGLPDGDGLSWPEAHPEWHGKGVVITSARGDERQRVQGIRQGADLYLVKPVSLDELTSLLHNLWRRLYGSADSTWLLQPALWTLKSPLGQSVQLTRMELLLLKRLAEEPGEALSREALAQALGQDPIQYDYRRMEILMRRLRGKVHDALGVELPVETVHRIGYAFIAPLRIA